MNKEDFFKKYHKLFNNNLKQGLHICRYSLEDESIRHCRQQCIYYSDYEQGCQKKLFNDFKIYIRKIKLEKLLEKS